MCGTTRWLKKYFRTCSLSSPWYKQFHVVTSEYADCGRQLEESCFVNYIFAIAIQNLVSLDEIPNFVHSLSVRNVLWLNGASQSKVTIESL